MLDWFWLMLSNCYDELVIYSLLFIWKFYIIQYLLILFYYYCYLYFIERVFIFSLYFNERIFIYFVFISYCNWAICVYFNMLWAVMNNGGCGAIANKTLLLLYNVITVITIVFKTVMNIITWGNIIQIVINLIVSGCFPE